jgi:hypothetical protein
MVEVDIDFDVVLPEVPTETLVEELRSRRAEHETQYNGTVRTAITQIQRGDLADAITTLEREFFPKWSSVDASKAAYLHATFLNNATAQAVAEEG